MIKSQSKNNLGLSDTKFRFTAKFSAPKSKTAPKKTPTPILKIISGELRGLKITTPGGGTHPMGERERLALFNMLSDKISGAVVLDAFSGSGAIGIEAISRGAKEVTFLENSLNSIQTIKKNLDLVKARSSRLVEAKVVRTRVRDFKTTQRFDVIIADPPYDNFDLEELGAIIGLLSLEGTFVLSHPDDQSSKFSDLAPNLPGLRLLKTKKYAGARLSVYCRANITLKTLFHNSTLDGFCLAFFL